ncbi:MAG: NifB/NifX family molybdenum-iron cluster-binding protein [Syntrophales bacterium]
MKVAVTVWEDTVSTVCDFSSRLLVFDVKGVEVKNRSFVPFETMILSERVNQLEGLGVEVLLCGAISRPLERMIRASAVKVIPCLRGSIEEVIAAYLADRLSDARFILPGFGPGAICVRGRRRRRGGVCRLPDKVKGDNNEG